MKVSLCCCAILISVAAASESANDLRKGAERFASELIPKTVFERATDSVAQFNHFMEDVWDGVRGGVSGGGHCVSDNDCNALLGHCDKHEEDIPSCEPTPLAYWMILMAILAGLVIFVFPITDDRQLSEEVCEARTEEQ